MLFGNMTHSSTQHSCFSMEKAMDWNLMVMEEKQSYNCSHGVFPDEDHDVSGFLLFEASGDSENAASDHQTAQMDVDDAASCSWESADIDSDDISSADEINVNHEDCDGGVDRAAYHSYVDDDHGEGEEEVDSSSVYQRWENQLKSTVSVDSTKFERLNEVEKSKLFWETCLAS